MKQRSTRTPQRISGDKRRQADISAQERALFRDAVGPVNRLSNKRKRPQQRNPPPSARPRQTEADEQAVIEELLDAPPLDIETGDNLSWRRNGVQLTVLRKLRRGHYRCEAELDLHGMTVAMAKAALAHFLHDARSQDWRCVRIVHGKGLRSGHRGPVLKAHLGGWLQRRDEVMAFCSTPDNDGGTGAIYVLLRTG